MFAQQWEEVSQLIFPEQRNTFYYGSYNFPGLKKTDRQVDSTGMLALWRFAAICDSLLTPANMQWHGLCASDEYVMKDRATALWFENATKTLFKERYAPHANFAGQNYANFMQLGSFGTDGMFVDGYNDPATGLVSGLRYRSEALGGLFITENHQGQVDGFFRWLRMTARQIYIKFGPNNFPQNIKGSLDSSSPLVFNIIHHVCRRADYDPQALLDKKGKPWASYYVSMDAPWILEEAGYYTFPLACGRYLQAPGEVYGRGPAMMVLPSLKTLNAQKRTFLKVGHREGDPILLTADDGILDGVSLRPGAQIKGGIDPQTGRLMVMPLPTGKIQTTLEMMQEERSIIDDAFLVNLFKVLEDNPNMSATAVVELANQKGILMAPTMGRQQSEYLGTLVVRELDELMRQGKLDPMPPRLVEAQGEFEVVYTTPMSRALRMGQVTGYMHALEMAKEVATATGDNSVMYPFATQRSIPAIAEILSSPPSWMSTPAEIKNKAAMAQRAQQIEQKIQAASGQAALQNAQTKQQEAQAKTSGSFGAATQGQPPPGTFQPINLQQPQGQ